MKFDFIIGNPPYQEETEGTSDKQIYYQFMDAAYEISDKVELITPARFLFNAGKTPKKWNQKMLNDPHLKILYYEQNSGKVFPNTDIKGGIAVSYRDSNKIYGAIGAFSQFEELRNLRDKIQPYLSKGALPEIMILQNRFDLNVLYEDYPEYKSVIGSGGKERRIVTSAFDKLSVFHEKKECGDDIEIYGIVGPNKRTSKWINKKYALDNGNLQKWKVILPKANGSGAIGEVLSTPLIGTPLIGTPLIGYTQSFIGVGAFDSKNEAEAAMKYVKSKFTRVLLGILKITQDNPPEKWKLVPLQDFTENSDIDWSVSIPEIDRQLYAKYGLDETEIEFIETHVKEMS